MVFWPSEDEAFNHLRQELEQQVQDDIYLATYTRRFETWQHNLSMSIPKISLGSSDITKPQNVDFENVKTFLSPIYKMLKHFALAYAVTVLRLELSILGPKQPRPKLAP
jgi:hypothetical protein